MLASRSKHLQYLIYHSESFTNMINRKKLRNSIEQEPSKTGFIKWLETQVLMTKEDLSDSYCRFYINHSYQIRGNTIIVQLYCEPISGCFAGIQFRPKIFINSTNLIERPRIYNDRRIFHPNINIYTCEFISKQLALDWNPTNQYLPLYKRFHTTLRHLKYLIIEPNCQFVPNNQFNRKAAWNYHFNRTNYRNLLQKNCPLFLDSIISNEMNDIQNQMEDQTKSSQQKKLVGNDDFWGVNKIVIKKSIPTVLQSFDLNTDEEQNFNLLAKKINYIVIDTPSSAQTVKLMKKQSK